MVSSVGALGFAKEDFFVHTYTFRASTAEQAHLILEGATEVFRVREGEHQARRER